MENSTTSQHFLDYLNFERRFSEHTAKCFGADLTQFGEFLVGASETSHLDTMQSQTLTSIDKAYFLLEKIKTN